MARWEDPSKTWRQTLVTSRRPPTERGRGEDRERERESLNLVIERLIDSVIESAKLPLTRTPSNKTLLSGMHTNLEEFYHLTARFILLLEFDRLNCRVARLARVNKLSGARSRKKKKGSIDWRDFIGIHIHILLSGVLLLAKWVGSEL